MFDISDICMVPFDFMAMLTNQSVEHNKMNILFLKTSKMDFLLKFLSNLLFLLNSANCSDFRYESNRIFVLGVGFFFRQISTF